jgi:N-dimethylarginine dimethylaminohydrolase
VLHLLSVISPISDDLAVVDMPLLPSGLYRLLEEVGVKMIEIPQEEVASLACNLLAVRPGVVVAVAGNPVTRHLLEAAGVEVHAFAGHEIAVNGSGGPTCLTRPIHRS